MGHLQHQADGVTYPSGGRTCTADDHGTSLSNFAVYWHVVGANDVSGGTVSWNSTSSFLSNELIQVAGANQNNPLGLCQASTTGSNTSNSITGGSSDINALAVTMTKNSSGYVPSFGSPPTGFYQIDVGAANSQDYQAYYPRSATVPAVVATAASTNWGNLQFTVLPDRTQTALMPFNAGAPPCWQGESNCTMGLTNLCKQTITSSSGGGTFTNNCVTANSLCSAQDLTTPADNPSIIIAAPSAGSVAYTGATTTDHVTIGCQ